MLTILVLILPFILPDLDIDSDGFMAREERAVGCDPFNRESFPVCGDLDGDGIGEWPLIAPRCEMGDGLAPCA